MKFFGISEEMNSWEYKGIFVREGKYRFHCHVEVEGEDKLCYIPSNCKLEKLLSLAGREVLLRAYEGSSDKFKYVVEAVRYRNSVVLLNLQFLNRIVEEQIKRKIFSFLGNRKTIQHEFFVENYKSDLFITETSTLIEIKSLLTWEKIAEYPMDSSDRNLEQLQRLSELLTKQHRICYLVFSLNPYVKGIDIKKSAPYGKLLSRCIDNGMIVKAYSIGGNRTLSVKREIPINIV